MSKKMPPAPPAARSNKGPNDFHRGPKSGGDAKPQEETNLKKQGWQGNIHQNTTNQGYRQDR